MIVLHAFICNINSIILYTSLCNLLFITLYFKDASMLKHAALTSSLISIFYCVKYTTILFYFQWKWVAASSRSWWWTGRPGVLQSMGSQRVRHDWATSFSFSLFTAICKASSDNHLAFLHFFFLRMFLIPASYTMSWTSIHSSSGTLSIRSVTECQSNL